MAARCRRRFNGELQREHERLKLLEDQIKALQAQRREQPARAHHATRAAGGCGWVRSGRGCLAVRDGVLRLAGTRSAWRIQVDSTRYDHRAGLFG
jgi:hypothetical protein